MTIRPKRVLEIAAVLVSVASCTSFAQNQASSATLLAPPAASAPTAVPALVPYSGVVVGRDGHAMSSETGITFLIYKDQHGGEPLFIETQSVVPDSTGHFTARLGASLSSGIPVDLFSSGEARWLEVQISGEPEQPRVLLASVPYALKAADAATLGGLPASAFALAGNRVSASTATATAAALPAVTSTAVTTPGGTSGLLPVFTGASTIANSNLYFTTGKLGIGKAPSTALDVSGATLFEGMGTFAKTATATSSTAYSSNALVFQTSAYNSSTKAAVSPFFQLQGQVTNNNTSGPGAQLHLLYGNGTASATDTGFYINSNGTVHFTSAQTFPGATGTGAPVCFATGGGFGSGGTTFVAPSFAVPAGGGCSPWSGFTKTGSTVVLTTSGAACVSTDAKKLTLSVSSADPNYLGAGTMASDYIQLTRASTSGSFTSGSDQGQFSGSAVQITCTTSLLQLNETND